MRGDAMRELWRQVSGSSGRSLLLLVANVALLILGILMTASGSIMLGIWLLHLLTFASSLYLLTPALLIASGALTVTVAIFGLALFRKKKEASGWFVAYAVVLFLALVLSVTASITSFVLRDSIAHRFYKTNVRSEFAAYATRPQVRARWDALQTEYSCCGGFNSGTGYTDWEGLDVEPLPIYAEQYFETQAQVSQLSRAEAEAAAAAADLEPTLTGVPDTCCLRRYRGCGRDAFEDAPDSSALREVSISEKIHVNGCMDVIRGVLFKHVMPILMICALVALVVALIELLLLFCAACFADHIRKSRIIAITQAKTERKISMESPGVDRSRIMDDVDDPDDVMHTGYLDGHLDEGVMEYGLMGAPPPRSQSQFSMHAGTDSGIVNNGKLSSLDGSLYDPGLDVKIRHQLPLLEGSPSVLRKNRFFFQSQTSLLSGNNNRTIGIHHQQLPDGGTNLQVMHMYAASPHHPDLSVPAISGQEDPDRGSLKSVMNDKDAEEMTASGAASSVDGKADEGNAKVAGKRKSRFHAWLDSVLNMKNKNNLETFELGNKPKLREEAIDRENTLMNVLKSVKSKQSKEDLAAGTEAASTTSTKGFSFFGMRSKSKENVLTTAPTKLPTVDKAIDQSRKYKPMENLADIKKNRSSSLDRLKKKLGGASSEDHVEIEDVQDDDEAKGKTDEKAGDESINFEIQKGTDDNKETKIEESKEENESDYAQVNKLVASPKTSPAQSSSGIGTASPRAMSPNQDFDTLEADRGSAKSPTSTLDSRIGDSSKPPLPTARASRNRRSERRLSLTSNPKLNTIHEPKGGSLGNSSTTSASELQTQSLQQINQSEQREGKSPVGNRTYTNPIGTAYYGGGGGLSKLSRSQGELHQRPSLTTSFVDDDIVTTISSSQNNLNHRDHITRISVTERRLSGSKDQGEVADEATKDKKESDQKGKKRKDSKSKKTKKSKKKDKKKNRSSSDSSSSSESDGSESSDASSDESSSDDSSTESSSSDDGRSGRKKRSKSKSRSSKSRSKSKDRKSSRSSKRKSSKHRPESPSRRKKSSKKSKKSKAEPEPKTKETGTDAAKPDANAGGEDAETNAAAAATFTDGLGGQVIYHQQRGGPGNTYENVDILRVHPGGHQLHDVHFVHPIVGAEVPAVAAGAAGGKAGEVAYYTTTLPHQQQQRLAAQRLYGTTGSRATSEPRKKHSLPSSHPAASAAAHHQQPASMDRYSMPGRSKSADRIPMRMRRASEHMGHQQQQHQHHHHGLMGHPHPHTHHQAAKSVSIAAPPDHREWHVHQPQDLYSRGKPSTASRSGTSYGKIQASMARLDPPKLLDQSLRASNNASSDVV